MTTDQTDAFSLTFWHFDHDPGMQFVSAVLQRSGMSHRITFRDSPSPDEVFEQSFMEQLAAIFRRIPDPHGVFSDREFRISTKDFALKGLRLMCTLRDGMRQVIVRFNQAVGAIGKMFKKPVLFDDHAPTDIDGLAVRALMDIVMPTFNIIRNADDLRKQPDMLDTALDVLAGREAELRFYCDLLTRYISTPAERTAAHDSGLTQTLRRFYSSGPGG